MFMRFVHYRVQHELIDDFRRRYEEVSIPALKTVPGCRSATLIQGADADDEWISMTIWDSRDDAEAYEKSDVYKTLSQSSRLFLAQSSEWRVQLNKDLQLALEPVPEEPVVRTYEVAAHTGEGAMPGGESMYVRIVAPQVRRECVDEFRRLYTREILPVVRNEPGCRYAYLVEGADERDQFLSVTIWENARVAERYERSGDFQRLTEKVRHTFSGVYQWKMELEQSTGSRVVTTEDMTVRGYWIVTGGGIV